MSRAYLPTLLLLALVIEGSLYPFFMPERYGSDLIMVPRFLVVLLVFIGIFTGRSTSLVYALCFGVIYDVVYTELLGVYVFGFAVVGYVFALSYKQIQDSILVPILLALVAVALFDYYQYGLFRLIGITDMGGQAFVFDRLLPTLLLNGALAIVVLYPVKKLCIHVQHNSRLRER
ncbi:rod shape-determining protein MreD [Alkalihalophilus pseudofirmus]|uniref:rod shape-determining protein MreD n=1 Tax=Alkalihalophilus pseudofirmus TaxID=79885 RepID=UPI00259BEFAE|nr:rod shape-determining protein MreD [Alkalihalophilus pseudofirmus]WEG16100.1 rod shape-determining protein MreD [Alkalihalophilus pseudofirmus]